MLMRTSCQVSLSSGSGAVEKNDLRASPGLSEAMIRDVQLGGGKFRQAVDEEGRVAQGGLGDCDGGDLELADGLADADAVVFILDIEVIGNVFQYLALARI